MGSSSTGDLSPRRRVTISPTTAPITSPTATPMSELAQNGSLVVDPVKYPSPTSQQAQRTAPRPAHRLNPRTETFATPDAAEVASRPPGMNRAPMMVP